MQTADTVGKGGYTTALGMFQVDRKKLDTAPEQPQRVVIGNFEGLHNVEFEVNTFLIPAQLIYGIGERLDLLLGATFSTGGAPRLFPIFIGLVIPMTRRNQLTQREIDGFMSNPSLTLLLD